MRPGYPYPFHVLEPGKSMFVAHAGGPSEAAMRARVSAENRRSREQGRPERYRMILHADRFEIARIK